MEYAIIGLIVAAALACPVLMCGPMILRRIGILKGGAPADCMAPIEHSASAGLSELRRQRAKIDQEIRELDASAREASAHEAR